MARITELYEGSITQLASEGRLTLQVPDYCVGTPTPKTVNVDWQHFVVLKSAAGPPSVGRESGFLYFTVAGYKHYKSDLEAVFSDIRGNTWAQFEKYAESMFIKRAGKLRKAIETAEKRVQQLKEHLDWVSPVIIGSEGVVREGVANLTLEVMPGMLLHEVSDNEITNQRMQKAKQ